MMHLTQKIVFIILVTRGLVSAGDFDHEHKILNRVLNKYVKRGLVDYTSIIGAPQNLHIYLDQLASVSKESFKQWNEKEQLAFLINLYNAATLALIIENYPIKSIKKIKKLSYGPWDIKFIDFFDEKISLNHLEHKIIRQDYREARIHFAIVCAAHGCPPLRDEAYTAEKLDHQLQQQTRLFLSNKKKNYINTNILHLSPIFKWFREDFVKESGSVQAFVAPFFGETKDIKDYAIKYTHYDWSLNKQ